MELTEDVKYIPHVSTTVDSKCLNDPESYPVKDCHSGSTLENFRGVFLPSQQQQPQYIPHKSKANDKSSVWYYFLVSACGGPTAQCKSCNKVLKTCFGSTKGLLTHLKYHKIELDRKPGKPPAKKIVKPLLLKPKYEIIDGKIAPSSPTRSNSSIGFESDMDNLYEKQIEFVDGYLTENPLKNEDTNQNFEFKSPIAKRDNSYQRNQKLEDLKTRVEIQLMRTKTAYYKKQIENADTERSIMLLKAQKLELEVQKLRQETITNTLPPTAQKWPATVCTNIVTQ